MNQPAPSSRFEPDQLRKQSWVSHLLRPMIEHLNPFFAILRWSWPIPRFRLFQGGRWVRFAAITRYENVREVLTNDTIFGVPYGPDLERFAGSRFLLGRDDGEKYRADLKLAMRAFPLSDIPSVADIATRSAEAIIRRAAGGIDVAGELARPILTEICERYLGVLVDDKDFPLWAMAVAGYLIEPLGLDDPVALAQADAGAQLLREAVDRSRHRVARYSGLPDSVLKRLVQMRRDNGGPPDDTTIRALIIGVIIAIIPTGMLAAGNMMEMLLRRPDMMAAARQAARAGDPDLLRRCLFEVLRFKPIIPFWPRECKDDFRLAAGRWRSPRIRKGTRVLVATQSAMLDPRQVGTPKRFDPGRPAADYMHFGYGPHHCLGAAIASAVIPAMLRPLLLCDEIKRGRGRRTFFASIFPERLPVNFLPLRSP